MNTSKKILLAVTGLFMSSFALGEEARPSPQDEELERELGKQEFSQIAQDLAWNRQEPWEDNLDWREREREWEQWMRVQELWELEREG